MPTVLADRIRECFLPPLDIEESEHYDADPAAQAERRAYNLGVSAAVAVVKQYEREQAEATARALTELRAAGMKTGGAVPYGFELAADGKTLKPRAKERKAIGIATKLRAQGAAYRSIANTLAERGLVARSGKKFKPQQIHRMVKRAK